MPDDLTTYAENTWCPGCGNFGIFNAFKNAVRRLEQEDGISRNNILITAGIGCHAKIFDYLDLSGFYSLHGREIATAQGMKLANPRLPLLLLPVMVTLSGKASNTSFLQPRETLI